MRPTRPMAGGEVGAAKGKEQEGPGQGATKAKPAELPTERSVRDDGGLKVVVSGRKGFDVLAWIEALENATAQARGQLVGHSCCV